MAKREVEIVGSKYVLDGGVWKHEDNTPVENELLQQQLYRELELQADKEHESVKPDASAIPTAAPQVAEPIKSISNLNPVEELKPVLPRPKTEAADSTESGSKYKTIKEELGQNAFRELFGNLAESIQGKIKGLFQTRDSDLGKTTSTPTSNADAIKITPDIQNSGKKTPLDSIQKDVSDITKMLKEGEKTKVRDESNREKERKKAEDERDESETQEAIRKEEGERGKGRYLTVGEELNRDFGRNLVAELPGLNIMKQARMMQQDPKSGIGGTDIIGGLLPSKNFLKKGAKAGAAGLILGGGSYLMDQQAEAAEKEKDKQSAAAWKVGSKAAEWATYGAMAGSFIPGVGTLAGGAIAGVGGAVVGAAENWDDLWGEQEKPKSVSPMPKAATQQQTTSLTQNQQQLQMVKRKAETPKMPVINNIDNKTINNNLSPSNGGPTISTAGSSGSLFQLAV